MYIKWWDNLPFCWLSSCWLEKLVYMDSILIFLKYFGFFVDDIVNIPIKWKFVLTGEYNVIAIELFTVF